MWLFPAGPCLQHVPNGLEACEHRTDVLFVSWDETRKRWMSLTLWVTLTYLHLFRTTRSKSKLFFKFVKFVQDLKACHEKTSSLGDKGGAPLAKSSIPLLYL